MGRSHGLRVYFAAREFADAVNALARRLPRSCPAGLRSQLVTAARSVSNAISEGAGRGTPGEKLQYFRIARGSIEEAQDQLRELGTLKLITQKTFDWLWSRAATIDRMLASLIHKLERG